MTIKQSDVQSMWRKWCRCLVLLLWILLLPQGMWAWGSITQEQTVFEADPSQNIAHPVPLPDSVLQVLAKDKDVVECLKDNPITRARSLASWFSASEIHLNGPDESDLVVLPVGQGDPYMCFHSTEGVGWFWVFGHTGERYQLVLKAAGMDLIVQDARHNGYRDIQTESQVGAYDTRVSFQFENGSYREYRRRAEELK